MRTREEDVELVYDKSRSGTSERSSKIQQWSQERDHLNVQGRHLESEKLACQSAIRSRVAQKVQIPQLTAND